MNARGKFFASIVLALALVMPLREGRTASRSFNPEVQKLLEAAKAEGGVINAVSSTYDSPGFGKEVEQGMAEYFLAKTPFMSRWTARTGQLTGLPERR